MNNEGPLHLYCILFLKEKFHRVVSRENLNLWERLWERSVNCQKSGSQTTRDKLGRSFGVVEKNGISETAEKQDVSKDSLKMHKRKHGSRLF